MGRKGVESLVTKLLPVQADEKPAGVTAGDRRPPDGRAGEPEQADGQPHSERDEPTPHSMPTVPTNRTLSGGLRPRTLALTSDERDFAFTVGCILRTPRSVKKFTNLYRLVRARLDEESGELDAFLDAESDDIPEYQAVLVLLAVIIAFPDEAPAFLLDLGDLEPRTDPDRRPWRDHVDELKRLLAVSCGWTAGLRQPAAPGAGQGKAYVVA